MNNLTKVYSIRLEMSGAQEQLDLATKTLAELKNRAQAANQEGKDAKRVYEENARALRELVTQQKQLTQAQAKALPGDAWGKATAALNANLKEQARLNSILEESRLDYAALSQAAETATGAVGQQAATVRGLADSVKQYKEQAAEAARTFAPGTFGAIEQEIDQLRAELQHLTKGSAEAAAAIQKIGAKEAELRQVAQAIKASQPQAQAKAFNQLTASLESTVTVATAVGQTFGLSEKTAQAYTQQMQQLTGVLASVDSMSKLLSGQNVSLGQSLGKAALGWLGFGASAAVAGAEAEAASTAAVEGIVEVEGALVSSGVGALLVGLGLLLTAGIALWHKLGESSAESSDKSLSAWTKFKANFMGGLAELWSLVKSTGAGLWAALVGDVSGFVESFRTAGAKSAKAWAEGHQAVLDEAHREELARQVAHNERLIKVMQAKGFDTERIEHETLRKKVAALKAGEKEYQDAVAELAAFNAAARRRHQQEAETETLAHLNRLLGLQQAYGRSTYQLQVQMEEERLRQLEAAPERDKTAIRNQLAVIQALKIAHEKDTNDKLFAARQAALEGQIALEEAKGEDAYRLEMRKESDRLAQLQAAGTQDLAAIKTQQDKIKLLTLTHNQELDEKERQQQAYAYALNIAELEKAGKDSLDLRLKYAELIFSLDKTTTEKEREQKRQDYEALLALQVAYNARQREIAEGQRQDRQDQEWAGREAEQAFTKAAFESNTKLVEDSLAKKKPDLGLALIKALFGMDGEKAQALKQALTEMAGQLAQAGQQLASALLDGAMQQTQQALEVAQQQLQEASDKLSEAQSKAQTTAAALDQATGARKQYLLDKLTKERREVAELAAAKKKAADEEAKQTREQHRLEKISAELAAGSALATNLATAAQAVYAGVKAVSAGSSIPFPGNIVAIAAGIAAVVAAVASAKQLASAAKYEAGTGALGSDGVLRGPRHSGGGVQLYGPNGVHWGEAEGGEAISPRDASTRNAAALALIRTEGRSRTLGPLDYMRALGEQAASVQRVPAPDSYFEPGGVLNRNGAPRGGQVSAADMQAVAGAIDRQNVLLQQIVDNGTSTASAADIIAKHAANTAATNQLLVGYGPPRLAIGHYESMQIEETRQEALNSLASLVLGDPTKDNTLRKMGWAGSRP